MGILSPRTIANVRVSFSRYLEQDRSDANMGYDMTKLGFPSSLVSQLPGGPFFGYYNIADYGEVGRYPSGSITNTWALAPNIARSAGAHSLKAGVDMRWIQYIVTDFGNPMNLICGPQRYPGVLRPGQQHRQHGCVFPAGDPQPTGVPTSTSRPRTCTATSLPGCRMTGA